MLLRKKTFQIGLAAVVFAVGSLFAAGAALAINPPEDPNAGDLIVTFNPNPLFYANSFLPGDIKTGEAKVTNGTTESKRIATEAINYPKNILGNVPNDDLSRALIIIIREKDGSDLYGGSSSTGARTLFDFYKNGETYLSSIPGLDPSHPDDNVKTYQFVISFPENADEKWNMKDENSNQPPPTTSFDIIVGFQGTEGGVEYCNKNGIQDNNETGIDCGGGGCPACGSGGGGLPPGLTIQYERDVWIGTITAKITWFTSYKATSRVVYDTQAGKFNINELSNYGYAFSTVEQNTPANPNGVTYHEVWLTNLQPSTIYYYRAVSHASPPTISREHSFTTLAMGDGEDDEHAPSPSQEGKSNGLSQEGGDDNGAVGGIYPKIRGAAGAVSGFISSLFGSKTKDIEGRVAGAEENENADESKAGENETDIIKPAAETRNGVAGECGKYPAHLLWLIILLLLAIATLLYYILRKRKEGENIGLRTL